MLNLEEQFDRIFKYLYFHLHDRHMAEDMTPVIYAVIAAAVFMIGRWRYGRLQVGN